MPLKRLQHAHEVGQVAIVRQDLDVLAKVLAQDDGLLLDVRDLLDLGICRCDRLVLLGDLDADLVDQFVALLGQCNVLTRGALRGFADDCPALITHMFEGQPLATLKANGLMATL